MTLVRPLSLKAYRQVFKNLAKQDKEFAEHLVFNNGLRGPITNKYIDGYIQQHGRTFPVPKGLGNLLITSV